AVNASSLNDGAAAMIVCSENFAQANGLTPVARIVAQGWNGLEPEWFTTAPVGAVQHALKAAEMSVSDIDYFELNEAFSVVALACQKDLDLPAEKLNVNGGAVALGHPLGATGARILTTLLHIMRRRGGKRGVAALCNGGGEATALVVEAL
ncbi:MAG: thiolase family protein, partial [Bdellovibrionales bacterium]|nr:thiolase family protein [Bdellovibrionales bacterium]